MLYNAFKINKSIIKKNMRNLYQIKINGEVIDKYAVYYKSTAKNIVILNILKAFELKKLNKPEIELIKI